MPDDGFEDDAIVKGRRFSGPNLVSRSGEAVEVEQCAFENVRFEKCDLTGAQFTNVVIQPGVSFDSCTLIDVGGAAHLKGTTVRGPGGMELALSLARETDILFEP
ncbi:pentapeptide repeat-containing protein [Kitasatospora sp. NPDC094011]|uniref:pentapeptide repeat-containing protein n=1 Tax=Kitasatospora sp. NPDC094011 TaxID=3364090 RepID=UPI0038048029